MITTYKVPYRDGELRIGWASWDDGSLTSRSIKYAYRDGSGKISRGSPELPIDMLMDMAKLAAEQNELRFLMKGNPMSKLSSEDLQGEGKKLKLALLALQKIQMDLPWATVRPLYDEIGARYDAVNGEIEERRKKNR